mmetsp:Transcript_85668/g.156038  ORF Transcript_85668/g.156038 Transcript_85668/m.156038 type:complete len:420 (+) Transcript_85668:53-1312(+)
MPWASRNIPRDATDCTRHMMLAILAMAHAAQAAQMRSGPYLSRLSNSEASPWECYEYDADQNDDWCLRTKHIAEYEFTYTGGQSQMCGGCRCCWRKSAVSATQAAVHNLTAKFIAAAPTAVSRVRSNAVSKPSSRHPFIFFHLRKAGGTTVRRQLASAAAQLRVRSFVACEGNVPCETYDPPQDLHAYDGHDIAMFGGHLYFPSVAKSLYLSQIAGARVKPADLQFDCLVLVRKPVSRVESCWNYRMVQEGGSWFSRQSEMSAMQVSDLAAELPGAMSSYGEGCNNEAIRVLSNSGRAEESVNGLTSDQQWSSMAPMLLEETLDHMQRCVVGVLERCEDTEKAVHGFFPWFSSFDCKNSKLRQGAIPHAQVKPEVQKEIERQNALDLSVYEVANAMLDAQLAELEHPPQAQARFLSWWR